MSKHRQLMFFCTAVLFLVLFSLTTGVQAQEEPRSPNVPQIEGGRPAEVAEYPSTGVLSSSGLCTSDVITTHVGLTDLHCITKPLQFPKQGPLIGSLSFGHPNKRQQVALPVNAYMAPILRYQPTTGNTPPRNVDVAIAITNQDLIATRYPVTIVAASITLPKNQLSGISPIAKGFGITRTHGSTPQWLQVYDKPLTWRYPGEADCHQDFARARLSCIFENPNNPETDIMLPGDSGGAMVNGLDAHGSVITDTTKQPVIATNTAYMSGTLALVTDLTDATLNAELRKLINGVESYYSTNAVWTVPALPSEVPVTDTVSTQKVGTDSFQIVHRLTVGQVQGLETRIYNAYLNTLPAFSLRDCPVQLSVETNAGGTVIPFRGYNGEVKADIIAVGETGVTALTITQTISLKKNAPVQCISSSDIAVIHTFTPTIYMDAVFELPDGRMFPLAVDTIKVPQIQVSTSPVVAALTVTPQPHQPYTNTLSLNYALTLHSSEVVTLTGVQVGITSTHPLSGCVKTVAVHSNTGVISETTNVQGEPGIDIALGQVGDENASTLWFGHTIDFDPTPLCVGDEQLRKLHITTTASVVVNGVVYDFIFHNTAAMLLERRWLVYLPIVQR